MEHTIPIHFVSGEEVQAVHLSHHDVVGTPTITSIMLEIEVVAGRLVLTVLPVEHAQADLQQAEVDAGIFHTLVKFFLRLELAFACEWNGLEARELAVKGDEVASLQIAEDLLQMFAEVFAVDVHAI